SGPEIPTAQGQNGLWMIAYNTNTLSERYSLWSREIQTDTRLGATAYQVFSASDGTEAASYRNWKVSYDHGNSQLSAYLDDTLIGSTSLTGRGFEHGLMVSFGLWGTQTNVSGTVNIDIIDFTVSGTGMVVDMSSDQVTLIDGNNPNYLYYEKYDSTVDYRKDFSYETSIQINAVDVIDNVCVYTIGSIENGARHITLAALATGTRQIGFYSGGDPREETSYLGKTNYNWTDKTTYKLVVAGTGDVNVYLDGSSTPSISLNSSVFPLTSQRKVGFGVRNPEGFGTIRTVNDNTLSNVTVSGSWTTYAASTSQSERALYGLYKDITVGSVDDKILFYFDYLGDASVYTYYPSEVSIATDAPYTIYHSGVVDTPPADSYTTNPVTGVYDNLDEYGNTNLDATTIDISQQRLANGGMYNSIDGKSLPSGFVYLGTYTDVSIVVLTGAATAGIRVYADSVLLRGAVSPPKSRSSTKVYHVNYTVGEDTAYSTKDFESGFTVIDLLNKVQLDAYSDRTSPAIADDDVYDLDVTI
ncbi:hypothetical protein LCGC14_1811080, partial [marine sediment metagenome]